MEKEAPGVIATNDLQRAWADMIEMTDVIEVDR